MIEKSQFNLLNSLQLLQRSSTNKRNHWCKRLASYWRYWSMASEWWIIFRNEFFNQFSFIYLPLTGTLRIIDRKKHIFKLSQGEYIVPEKIENVYQKSKYIEQVFVHGESLKVFITNFSPLMMIFFDEVLFDFISIELYYRHCCARCGNCETMGKSKWNRRNFVNFMQQPRS